MTPWARQEYEQWLAAARAALGDAAFAAAFAAGQALPFAEAVALALAEAPERRVPPGLPSPYLAGPLRLACRCQAGFGKYAPLIVSFAHPTH